MGIVGQVHLFTLCAKTIMLCRKLQVKQALWAGGIARSNKPEGKRGKHPGLQGWDDLVSGTVDLGLAFGLVWFAAHCGFKLSAIT